MKSLSLGDPKLKSVSWSEIEELGGALMFQTQL